MPPSFGSSSRRIGFSLGIIFISASLLFVLSFAFFRCGLLFYRYWIRVDVSLDVIRLVAECLDRVSFVLKAFVMISKFLFFVM